MIPAAVPPDVLPLLEQQASIEGLALAALCEKEPLAKCAAVANLHTQWVGRQRMSRPETSPQRLTVPGRPVRPALLAPEALPKRSPYTPLGHAALIHAIAHIEFNAINLALDCIYRFSHAGIDFIRDWIKVAAEEAQHFTLLSQRLAAMGHAYGDFDAHNGLWEMALRTDHDFIARMALVPRLLEARGLDATPPIQAKLQKIGDTQSLAILDIILRDEVGHVAIGDHWFRAACAAQGRQPEEAFTQLLAEFGAPLPRPPLNREARKRAGFSDAEMDAFEQGKAAMHSDANSRQEGAG